MQRPEGTAWSPAGRCSLDELRIYNRAITAAEAQALYSDQIASYTYDGNGARATQTSGGETVAYYNRYLQKNLTTGEVTKYYFFGGKLVAQKVGSNDLVYFHQDHLTGTSVMSSDSGAAVSTVKYFPFGATRSESSTLPTDKKFTGQRLDGTGLYFYNARYYDPEIGRFVSADTIVLDWKNPQTLNRYTYVFNNPLVSADPSGHGCYGCTDAQSYDYDLSMAAGDKEYADQIAANASQRTVVITSPVILVTPDTSGAGTSSTDAQSQGTANVQLQITIDYKTSTVVTAVTITIPAKGTQFIGPPTAITSSGPGDPGQPATVQVVRTDGDPIGQSNSQTTTTTYYTATQFVAPPTRVFVGFGIGLNSLLLDEPPPPFMGAVADVGKHSIGLLTSIEFQPWYATPYDLSWKLGGIYWL